MESDAEQFVSDFDALKKDPGKELYALAILIASGAEQVDRMFVDSPNGSTGFVACWFNDGSFGAVVLDPRHGPVLSVARRDGPEIGNPEKLRQYLADEVMREL